MRLILTQIIILVVFAEGQLLNYSRVKPCKKLDPKLDDCLRENFNKIYENAKVPNEVALKKLSRDLVRPPLNISLNFRDVSIKGFSYFYFSNIRADLENSKFDLELVIPKLEVDGLYQLSGQILLIPLNGNGKLHLRFDGMKLFINILTSKIQKNSETFLQIDELSLDYSIKNAKSKIEEQHSKDFFKVLTNFFNENAQLVVDQFKGPISEVAARIFKDLLKKELGMIPERVLYVD